MTSIWDEYQDISGTLKKRNGIPQNSSPAPSQSQGSIWDEYEDISSTLKRRNKTTPNNAVSSHDPWAHLPEGIQIARQKELERQQSLTEDSSPWEKFKSYVGAPVTNEDYEKRNARLYAGSQVATLGFGDELYGIAKALAGNSYTESRDKARNYSKEIREKYPRDYNMGTLAGVVGTTALTLPVSIPARLAGVGGNMVLGALSGYGTSESHTKGGQAFDTAVGTGLGAVGGVAGRAIGEGLGILGSGARNIVKRIKNGKDPLSTEEGLLQAVEAMKTRASEAYKAADDAGVVLKPEFTKNLYKDIENSLAESAYTPRLQPGIGAVLAEIREIGEKNTTLKGIDNIRKIVGSVSADGSLSERRLAGQITEIIDRKIGNVTPDELLGGNLTQATQTIQTARQDWKTQAKLSQVANLLDKAERRAAASGSGGNKENTLRQNMNKILNTKEGRGWTDAEKTALRTAVAGSPSQNTLRLMGKMSPETGALGVTTGLSAVGASGIFGNPWPLALPALGYGAKKASEAINNKNALNVIRTILNGGQPTHQGIIPPQTAKKLIEYLSRGGAIGLSSQSNDL